MSFSCLLKHCVELKAVCGCILFGCSANDNTMLSGCLRLLSYWNGTGFMAVL